MLEQGLVKVESCHEKPLSNLDQLSSSRGVRSAFGEFETRQTLGAYGIKNVPGGLATTVDAALGIANKVGYPVVIKIVAESILHKSDAGGIRLNLQNEKELRLAYKELFNNITQNYPTAEISGFMIEKMADKGLEVIVGMKRDVTFGPVIMFGLGGTMVELVKDIALKVAPLSEKDLEDLFDQTIAGKLMKGFRGSKPADIQAVKHVIRRLSCLALQHTEVQEIEINPLVVYPKGEDAIALDSRMILS